MEIREKILEATIDEFNEKSLKFTMDDIAKRLEMSKKTIYTIFQDKETLFFETVDYCFAAIKESEEEIIQDSSLDVLQKIKRILIVLPNRYKSIDWRQIYVIKERYPRIYKKIEMRIETEWDTTIALLEEGMRLGRIKSISIPILKLMVESTIQSFLGSSILIECDLAYDKALELMIDILIDGIKVN